MAGVRVVEGATLFEGLSGRIPLRDLRPSWLVFSSGFEKPRVLEQREARSARLVSAAALLALTAPLSGLLALAVRLSGPGPGSTARAAWGSGAASSSC